VSRPGFALLTVLWIMAAAATVALALETTARAAVSATTNRVALERAFWRAADCLERMRDAIDGALAQGAREEGVLRIWRGLDAFATHSVTPRPTDCDATLYAAGSRLDVNGASDAQLGALLRSLPVSDPDRFADRVLDWRDPDDDTRPWGAERGFYFALGLPEPSNGAFHDIREVAKLADGTLPLMDLTAILSVERGRISLNHAPAPVLLVVPGFSHEVVDRILLERESGRAIEDLPSVAARVSPQAADSLMAHYPEVVALTTTEPDAWILEIRGWSGSPPQAVHLDARVVLDGARATVVRRRILP
jgi:type II secretory pathway component PulK